jgi:hypothetical protein
MDNIGDELDAVIRNSRKYAPFWECRPDRKIKEWGVVNDLLTSMHARGDQRYQGPINSVDDDWPDCVIRDSSGKQVGVEVTEFVDQEVLEWCERGVAVIPIAFRAIVRFMVIFLSKEQSA